MKIIFWIIGVLSLLNASAATIDPYQNINYFKLDNGLQVYLLADEKATKTQISLRVKVGYGVEDEGNFGISHLVEHIIFRDQRIPHHDYLDYIKEEGGTHVNGHTKRYETKYLATIASEKSYWITEIFAQMLFDKDVTTHDLEVEKGALQAEIGEPHWYLNLFGSLGKFFEKILPPQEDLYVDEFALSKVKDLPPYYKSQENNPKFTLEEVMEHYDNYYYPANTTLRIVGDFSTSKMKKLILEHYGKVEKSGTLYAIKPPEDPKLNHKPYRRFFEGDDENNGYIGAKYIIDDYKKYLTLDIYTINLSERLQQQLRNKEGKTYSVNAYNFSDRKAGIITISFDGLHEQFQDNILSVKKMIAEDAQELKQSDITKALASYEKKYYADIEHDNGSLISLVDMAQYLREEQNITDKTSFEIFRSITPEYFRQTIQETFTPQNSYSYISRDYYFFPLEMPLLSLLAILLFLFVYLRLGYLDLKKHGILYTKREIVMHRRLSSRFVGFMLFIIVFLLASIIWEWLKYLLSKYLMGDPYWIKTIDVPYSYIFTILEPIFNLTIFVVLYRTFFHYYARIDVTEETLYTIGNRVKALPKAEIQEITATPWKRSYYKNTLGTSLRFWRPVLQIKMQNGDMWYLRTNNAEHLEEDLIKWYEA